MANAFNIVTLMGNVAGDVVTKTVGNGMPLCDVLLSVKERVNRNGRWGEEESIIPITFFGEQSAALAQRVAFGTKLLVSAKLKMDHWEKDGKEYSRLRVRGEAWEVCGETSGNAPAESGEGIW
jgi:single stranded DNA-binding protein